MKFQTEYRKPELLARYAALLKKTAKNPWVIMEVCGGQTHSIVRHGIDRILPAGLDLIHGPGCPVCVTPDEVIDAACQLARAGIILCTFGDMLRVPGRVDSLEKTHSAGADVRAVYSPLDALRIAIDNPDRQVVFLAVGFETTAPVNALAVLQASELKLKNFSLLVSHVLVPPAIEAIMKHEQCRVQGFLAAGHVCTIMGYNEYHTIAERCRVPIVVTGFEPADILQGLVMCVRQLEQGRHFVENQYSRSVCQTGNSSAARAVADVFEIREQEWRGLGLLSGSGLGLKEKFSGFDARRRFDFINNAAHPERISPDNVCISGKILTGLARPSDCPEFGGACSPEHPLGAPMVSTEGACAAYYNYRRSAQS